MIKAYVNETISTPKFTQEEMRNLFKEFCDEYDFQIEDKVIEEIYTRTNGHAGHTCFCGKKIHENVRHTNILKFNDCLCSLENRLYFSKPNTRGH